MTMRRSLFGLYLLLSSPIPVPKLPLVRAMMVVLTYPVFFAHDPMLRTHGLSAVQLAIIAGHCAAIWYAAPMLARALRGNTAAASQIKILFSFHFIALTMITFAPAPVWIQHGVSVFWALYALVFAYFAKLDLPGLQEFSWPGRHWDVGQDNAANWHILRYLGLILANEWLVANASLSEWLIGFALLPILFHALFWWTINATHPFEEEEDR